MAAIVYASILTALVVAPALHLLGLRWRWAFLASSMLAAGLGWSAADAIGLL